MESSGFFLHNREQQQLQWLEENILTYLMDKMNKDEKLMSLKAEMEVKIRLHEIDPNRAAKLLLEKLGIKD